MTQDSPTYTYRGRSLEELVPRIRDELGDDAIIVGRRETTSGGVGGFFAKREIEVDVRPGEASTAAAQAFRDQLAAAQRRNEPAAEEPRTRPEVGPQIDALPSATDVSVDELFPPAPPRQSQGLAALFNAGLDPEADVPVGEPAPPRAPDEPIVDIEQPTGAFDFLQLAPSQPAPTAPTEPPSTSDPAGSEPAGSERDPALAGPAARDAGGRMAAHGLRAELADVVAADALVGLLPFAPEADPRALVHDALARRIPIHPLRHGPGVIAFVGPGGAGKTRCVARLAAAYARNSDLPVVVVTLHAPDDGAELTRLLAPYDTELHAVTSGAEGAARVAGVRGAALVIVDTPGVSPRNPGELQALGAELRALAPDEVHLAVPATIGTDAARELVGGVRTLGVRALALTHTDETEQLGTVVGLAIDAGLPLSYLARGQAVDAGLRPAAASELARCLMS